MDLLRVAFEYRTPLFGSASELKFTCYPRVHHIFSNKRRASNTRHPQITAAPLTVTSEQAPHHKMWRLLEI